VKMLKIIWMIPKEIEGKVDDAWKCMRKSWLITY